MSGAITKIKAAELLGVGMGKDVLPALVAVDLRDLSSLNTQTGSKQLC